MEATKKDIETMLNDVRNMIEKFKELYSKDCSISETLEMYQIRSYLLKNYGITSDKLIYNNTEDIVDEIREMIENNIQPKKIKLNLDDILNESEFQQTDFINDMVKSIRKNIIKQRVSIQKNGRKFKFEIHDGNITIKIPSTYDVEIDKNILMEKQINLDNPDTSSNTDLEIDENIIKSDKFEIPIMKDGKRKTFIKHTLFNHTPEQVIDVFVTLSKRFGYNKALEYFTKVFQFDDTSKAEEYITNHKKILDELANGNTNKIISDKYVFSEKYGIKILKKSGRGYSAIRYMLSKLSDDEKYDIIKTLEKLFDEEKVAKFVMRIFLFGSVGEAKFFIEQIKSKFENSE